MVRLCLYNQILYKLRYYRQSPAAGSFLLFPCYAIYEYAYHFPASPYFDVRQLIGWVLCEAFSRYDLNVHFMKKLVKLLCGLDERKTPFET